MSLEPLKEKIKAFLTELREHYAGQLEMWEKRDGDEADYNVRYYADRIKRVDELLSELSR